MSIFIIINGELTDGICFNPLAQFQAFAHLVYENIFIGNRDIVLLGELNCFIGNKSHVISWFVKQNVGRILSSKDNSGMSAGCTS